VTPRASAPPSDAARDVAGEEFLFHLYRGSELLLDNRVHEAKEELEHALLLQPRDPKGPGLARHGLLPHRPLSARHPDLRDAATREPRRATAAIELGALLPEDGQAAAAREELEEVVRANPEHRRAWGYLGLAFDRLGDVQKAQSAFLRGGHHAMARKVVERNAGMSHSMPPSISNFGPADVEQSQAVRDAAAKAFQELDAGDLSFALAEPGSSPPRDNRESGMWRELGQAVPRIPHISERAATSAAMTAVTAVPPAAAIREGAPRLGGAGRRGAFGSRGLRRGDAGHDAAAAAGDGPPRPPAPPSLPPEGCRR
jgi:hypothetical protein